MNDTEDDEAQLLCNTSRTDKEGIEMQSLKTQDETDPQVESPKQQETESEESKEPEKE